MHFNAGAVVDVLDGVVGPIGDVDVLGVVDSGAIVEFVVIVDGIPVLAVLAEGVVLVDVGIDVDVVGGTSVLDDGVMMAGVVMPWSVDVVLPTVVVVLPTVVVSTDPLFKTFLTAFISGYLPCPQMPRKSSVSIDQSITPPNCKSFTKSAFRLILSTSS